MNSTLDAAQFNQHRPALYKYAVRAVSDPDLAQDLVQDTFVAVVSLDDTGAGGDEDERMPGIETLAAPDANPEYQLEQKRFWESFRKLLERLPERTAQAFVMADFGGESTDEICAKLGVSRNNLWVLRHRARQFLRGSMSQATPA
jgi:DNA-directed RNA polymerase specialized sigma24 family protein